MSQQTIFEIIGYVGSALVLTSFLMASVVKLRIINSLGCIVSVIYGLLIHAYPTLVMNGALLMINIYFLWKMSKSKTAVYHVTRADIDDGFMEYFLGKYKEDIAKYFPTFNGANGACADPANVPAGEKSVDPANVPAGQRDFIRVSYCGDKAAGVLIGHKTEDGQLKVELDYTTPEYRDLSVARWLYAHLPQEGIKTVEVAVPTSGHEKYMEKIGFEKQGDKFLLKL